MSVLEKWQELHKLQQTDGELVRIVWHVKRMSKGGFSRGGVLLSLLKDVVSIREDLM